jgi:protein-L-isoaspartate(D-aspartate) O-methyltransferase
LEGLTEGGILVAPVGEERRDQKLLRVTRRGASFDIDDLGPVRFVPLVEGLPREPPQKAPRL